MSLIALALPLITLLFYPDTTITELAILTTPFMSPSSCRPIQDLTTVIKTWVQGPSKTTTTKIPVIVSDPTRLSRKVHDATQSRLMTAGIVKFSHQLSIFAAREAGWILCLLVCSMSFHMRLDRLAIIIINGLGDLLPKVSLIQS